MTSSNGNIFRVTGPLCGEFTGFRWIPRTKASDAKLCFFFYLRVNKWLRKQSWGWWFETLLRSLWRHRNEIVCHTQPFNIALTNSYMVQPYNFTSSLTSALEWIIFLGVDVYQTHAISCNFCEYHCILVGTCCFFMYSGRRDWWMSFQVQIQLKSYVCLTIIIASCFGKYTTLRINRRNSLFY